MSKYSKDLCSQIKKIMLNKKTSDFEKCDGVYMLFKNGFFGKELIENFPEEFNIVKRCFLEHSFPNSQWLSIRFMDRFLRSGNLHTLTDNNLKNTLGVQISKGFSKKITDLIKENNKQKFEKFKNKAIEKFGKDQFDYSNVIYIDQDVKIQIECKKCNNIFKQTPSRHLNSKFPCFQCVLYSNGYNTFDEHTESWSRVIPGLFIGNINSALDQSFLINKRIRAVIDLTNSSHQTKLPRTIKAYKISIEDTASAKITPYLKHTFDFITEMLEKNVSVLVFCRAGISRSATIVIYYLMRRYKISYYDAYRFLKGKRRYIQPNDGFVRQLQEEESNVL
jgi:hypothetical protein